MTGSVYAVTAASGHLGRFAVQELLARGMPKTDIVVIVCIRDKVSDSCPTWRDVRVADLYGLSGQIVSPQSRVLQRQAAKVTWQKAEE